MIEELKKIYRRDRNGFLNRVKMGDLKKHDVFQCEGLLYIAECDAFKVDETGRKTSVGTIAAIDCIPLSSREINDLSRRTIK